MRNVAISSVRCGASDPFVPQRKHASARPPSKPSAQCGYVDFAATQATTCVCSASSGLVSHAATFRESQPFAVQSPKLHCPPGVMRSASAVVMVF